MSAVRRVLCFFHRHRWGMWWEAEAFTADGTPFSIVQRQCQHCPSRQVGQ